MLAAITATPDATKDSLFGFRVLGARIVNPGAVATTVGMTTVPDSGVDDGSDKLSEQGILILLIVVVGVLVLLLVALVVATVRRRRQRYVQCSVGA